MGGLNALAWRSLLARPLRTGLTVVGIALGVAVLFAALATSAGIEAGIDATVKGIIGRADLRIEAFQERGLSAASVTAIAGTPGVAAAAPALERRTYLDRDPATPDPAGYAAAVDLLGIDPAVDGKVHDLPIAAGVPLAAGAGANGAVGQALITERLARETGLKVGDPLAILGAQGSTPLTIVGLLAGDGPPVGTDGRTVVVTLATAGGILGTDGATRVDVLLAPGATVDATVAALGPRLTADPYVLSGPAEIAASLRASTADFQATTALIAVVALFGGAFLIFNTLSMTVAERVREVGLLRAAGTTRRQVNNLVILQAAGLGIVGSVIGVGLGALLSLGMATAVRAIGVVPIGAPVLPVGGAVVALLVGLAVTIAAALEPAVRAGRIPPVEALRSRGEGVAAVRARLRWLIVVFAVVAAAGLAIWPSAAQVGLLRPFVVYLVLLGSTLLLPFVLGPLGRIAGLPFALFLPAEARLTRSSLVRDRSRTALTVGALAVGLAMIVALGSVAQDARRAATAWLVGVVPGDEVATSIRPIAPGEGVREQLVAIPGVARVSPIATFGLAFRGVRIDAAAVVGTDLLADGRLAFTAGDRRNALTALDAGGSAIVPRSVAERLAIQLGDTLDFTVGGGRTKAERVVGIVERGLPGRSGETIFVGWPDALGPFGVLGADAYAIRYAPGVGAGAVDALHALATGLALEPSPLERVSGSISDVLDRVFGLFDALALVAVVVAGLGIVNTLTMNVMERVREIGVLRALGMTRRQVWRMVVVEAAVLGIVGVVVGVAVGIVAGQVLVGLGGNGILQLPLDPPWRTIGLAAAFGFVVAVLAAAVPARAASRISIVRAVQAE